MAVTPAMHHSATKNWVSLKDLDGERMVLLSQHSFVRYQIDDAFSSLEVAPSVVLETPSSSIACALVAAGAGITLVSKWNAEPFAGQLVVVRPVKEAFASRYAIIFRKPGHACHWPTPSPTSSARKFDSLTSLEPPRRFFMEGCVSSARSPGCRCRMH